MRSFSFAILPASNLLRSLKLSAKPSGVFILSERSMAERRSINVDRVKPLASLSKILSAVSAPILVSIKAAVALKCTLASKFPPFSRWLTSPSTPCSAIITCNFLSTSMESSLMIWFINSCAETLPNERSSKSLRWTFKISLEEFESKPSSGVDINKFEKFANIALSCPFVGPVELG